MALTFPYKDPNEYLDYTIDWTDRIATGDSISASSWLTPSSGGITMVTYSLATYTTTVWLSSGTIGITYQLTNRITTAAGRVMDQTTKLKIKAK